MTPRHLLPLMLLSVACRHTPSAPLENPAAGLVSPSSKPSLEGLTAQLSGTHFVPKDALFVYSPQLHPDTMSLFLYWEETDCSRAPVASLGMVLSGVPRTVDTARTVGDGVAVQTYDASGGPLAMGGFSGSVTTTRFSPDTATVTLEVSHGTDGHLASGTVTASICEIIY